jgi:ribosomal protein L7/L12
MAHDEQDVLEIKARLEKLEARMTFLYRSLGLTSEEAPKSNASPRVIELLRQGDKTGAIRAFREETGAGLKDAKNYVESLDV